MYKVTCRGMHLYPIRMQLQSEERSINHAGRHQQKTEPACTQGGNESLETVSYDLPVCTAALRQRRTHPHTHLHIYTDTHIHTYTQTLTFTNTHRLTDTYSQAHIHTFTPTLTHKHSNIFFSKLSLKSYITKILEIFYTS